MKKASILILLFFCLLAAAFPSSADGSVLSYEPVTKIDLGIKNLTLEAGESYTFAVKFEPENTAFRGLNWYTTDDSVIRIDGPHFTVTALAPGSARIYAESIDSASQVMCDVLVNGSVSKDAGQMFSGSELIKINAADLSKIRSETLLSYINFLNSSDFSSDSFERAAQKDFVLLADVIPGTEVSESQRALMLGMTGSDPLEYLNMITLYGTVSQITAYAADNQNLISIFGGESRSPGNFFPDDFPASSIQKSVEKLEGKAEEISSFEEAHKLGYKGKGMTIAVLDTGLNKEHEQFKGRVIAEKCFSTKKSPDSEDSHSYFSVCADGAAEADSSAPSNVKYSSMLFQHGSHVTGIAAGKYGAAPEADIISVQIFTESVYSCPATDDEEYNNARKLCKGEDNLCCEIAMFDADELKAYNYLLDLKNKGTQIDVVNMSYGGGEYKSVCDHENDKITEIYKKMTDAGMILVGSTGNESKNDAIINPACISYVYSVGALADDPTLKIAGFSNHADFVDILAPGTNIISASYCEPTDGNNCIVCTDCKTPGLGTSEAAPMVSGAFALLKQAIPGKTVSEYKDYLKKMTDKKSNIAVRDWEDDTPILEKFNYSIPVLNFLNFETFIDSKSEKPEAPDSPDEPVFPIYLLKTSAVLPATGIHTSILPEKPASVSYRKLGWTLQIPSISVMTDIVEVPLSDGSYEVTWLSDSAGLLEGFPLPGSGTTLIAGHNHLNDKEAGPFALLSYVEVGDSIYTISPENELTIYSVFANEKIAETDFSALEMIAYSRAGSVILLSCEDERPEGGYANRRIVAAEPVR